MSSPVLEDVKYYYFMKENIFKSSLRTLVFFLKTCANLPLQYFVVHGIMYHCQMLQMISHA